METTWYMLNLLLLDFASGGYFILGPSKLEILETRNCSMEILPLTMSFTLRKYNATTQLLNTVMNIPYDIDESVAISLRSSKWNTNGWSSDFYTIEDDNACQALNKYVGPLWNDIQKQIAMTPKQCPIKMGKFKTRVRFMRYSKPIFCKDFIVLLSEKTQ